MGIYLGRLCLKINIKVSYCLLASFWYNYNWCGWFTSISWLCSPEMAPQHTGLGMPNLAETIFVGRVLQWFGCADPQCSWLVANYLLEWSQQETLQVHALLRAVHYPCQAWSTEWTLLCQQHCSTGHTSYHCQGKLLLRPEWNFIQHNALPLWGLSAVPTFSCCGQ